MKNKVLAAAGAAAFALTMSASASYAGFLQPGETMGLSLDSPLPEGVFFADLENYGRSKVLGPGTADVGVGVNIPVILWSTPWTFYNTRLEFLAAFPFAHVDTNQTGPASGALNGALNQTGFITWAFGPIFAHDFGNGLTGGVSAFVRTPSPSSNIREQIDGRTVAEGDFRESLQFTFKGPGYGFLDGITISENGSVTTALGQNGYNGVVGSGLFPASAQDDMFAGDFTISKTFDKFTLGFVGYGNINLDNRAQFVNFNGSSQQRNIALGGLIGYDFGKFTLTGIVTHTVTGDDSVVPGVSSGQETRGWVRLIVPLYVAPTAPVIAARY